MQFSLATCGWLKPTAPATRIWLSRKQIGAIPPDGTKHTHRAIRDMYKVAILALNYGMGVQGSGLSDRQAGDCGATVSAGLSRGLPCILGVELRTCRITLFSTAGRQTAFGWTKSLPWEEDCNPRSLKNFPAQANGAEILRLSACLGIERKIKIVAQVHDAVLIEASNDRIEHDIEVMLMRYAGGRPGGSVGVHPASRKQ